MRVIVCISYVPDITNELKISSDRKSVCNENLTYIINPFDEHAIEETVQLKEKFNAETIAVTFGPDFYKEVIRKAYSYGIDEGVLIKSNTDNYDSFTVAKNLAEFIREKHPDLIFFGKQSIDYENVSVQNMVGQLLNIPSLNVISKINYNEKQITLEKTTEKGKELITVNLPVLIGVERTLNIPRYPKLKDVLKSKSIPIEIKEPYFSENKIEFSELKLASKKESGIILNNNSDSILEIIRFLKEKVKII